MTTSSPPPSYSPPRPPLPAGQPPPPYDAQNNDNFKKESTVKVSPMPFVPLADIHHQSPRAGSSSTPSGSSSPSQPISVDPATLANHPLDRPTIIVYQTVPPAPAPSSAPYLAFCHRCQQEVRTRQSFVTGTFTWLCCVIVLFFFFPLAFVPFCLDSCKDVHHFCPKCATLISIKKRFL